MDKLKESDNAARKKQLEDAYCLDCGGILYHAEASFYCPVCGFSQETIIIDL